MLYSFFSFCTRSQHWLNSSEKAINHGDVGQRLQDCTFCNVRKDNGFDIVWQDDSFTAFRDHNPAASQHFLVIPNQHIDSVKSLRQADASMVSKMGEIGNMLLDKHNVPPDLRRLGFHIPPMNSVPHLHLHVHGLPYLSLFRRCKYPITFGMNGREKGCSWFVEAGQAVRILEKGAAIGLVPC